MAQNTGMISRDASTGAVTVDASKWAALPYVDDPSKTRKWNPAQGQGQTAEKQAAALASYAIELFNNKTYFQALETLREAITHHPDPVNSKAVGSALWQGAQIMNDFFGGSVGDYSFPADKGLPASVKDISSQQPLLKAYMTTQTATPKAVKLAAVINALRQESVTNGTVRTYNIMRDAWKLGESIT